MKRPANLKVFSLSFIDLFSCAFGGMMMLMVIFSIEPQGIFTQGLPTNVEIAVEGNLFHNINKAKIKSELTGQLQTIPLRRTNDGDRRQIGWTRLNTKEGAVRVVIGPPNKLSIEVVDYPRLLKVLTEVEQKCIDKEDHARILSFLEAMLNKIRITKLASEKNDKAMEDYLKNELHSWNQFITKMVNRDEQLKIITQRLNILQKLQWLFGLSNAARCKEQIKTMILELQTCKSLMEENILLDQPNTQLSNEFDFLSRSDPWLNSSENRDNKTPAIRISLDDGDNYFLYCNLNPKINDKSD